MKEKVSIEDFEKRIFEIEGIRVIIKTDKENIEPYQFQRRASGNITLIRFLRQRIFKYLENNDGVSIIKGNGEEVLIFEDLNSIRNSYK